MAAIFVPISIAGATLLLLACSDGPTEPGEACVAATSSVSPTVETDVSVTFSWVPACGVALMLIEESASDQWVIQTPEEVWDSPDGANRIFPPITYGQVPDGAMQAWGPEALQPGIAYQLVLWRVLPTGSEAGCIQTLESLCLVAVHEFTR